MRSVKAVSVSVALLMLGTVWAEKSKAPKTTPATANTAVATTTKSKAKVKESKTQASKKKGIGLERHLEEMMRTVPGEDREPDKGPGGAAEEAFQQRAYPDTDIPVARIDAARTAAKILKGRKFPTGKGKTGQWVIVGPEMAVYQKTPFRTASSYVPNEYLAAGRTTALAISPECVPGHCTLWAGSAGGGVWRTKNALDGQPSWQYLSAPFEINAVGSIVLDPNDPSGQTLWVGTGEANGCGSGCEAGVGLYKSTDGGNTWTGPIGKSVFNARAIGTIVIQPGNSNVMYVGTIRALRGASSVCCDGAITLAPGAPKWGLYKSTDGGQSWSLIHNGGNNVAVCVATSDSTIAGNTVPECSPRGVRRVALDPSDNNVVYASSFSRGVWRSTDGGATWTQINPSLNPANASMRAEFAVNKLANGNTRMYIYEGASGTPTSRLFRSDDTRAAAPVFNMLTSSSVLNDGFGSYNLCTGQCWYDNYVLTPPGHPDLVYILGSYNYNETGRVSNGRAVVLSTDGGLSFTDMTMDATDTVHPNGLHPDEHFMVLNPNNPFQFFESNDGGIVRSSGQFADISATCDTRNTSTNNKARCRQLLSRVPTELQSINKGLSTLQFQSLSVNPNNINNLMGGTQDNGSWQSTGNPNKWLQVFWGDGGQSGFDVTNRDFRFHTLYDAQVEVNFAGGAIEDWNWIADPFFYGPLAGNEPRAFYIPVISDPKVSGSMFAGLGHVWRTKTHGMGNLTLEEFRTQCNRFFGTFPDICGDWAALGTPGTAGYLTDGSWGDRAGLSVAAVERSAGDTNTLWAATSTGRVFISKNADAEPASSVTFSRLDSLSSADPNRFPSGIYVDPSNSNRAWISYNGYSASTPSTPGHVFEVVYNPVAGTATWTDRSYDLQDIPITDIVRDDSTGDLYASSDFGVFRLANGTNTWTAAAPGMPNVEVAGLTIVPGSRVLYAATHGLGAWRLNLP